MATEDTLARTARRIRPPDSLMRFALLAAGAALILIGFAADPWHPAPVVVGALAVGYSFRPEADRYYMEGFSDGVEAGSQLADERHAAGLAEDRASLRRDEPAATASGVDADQRSAGAPDPIGRYADDLPGLVSRPARNPITEDGRPIPASGPRSPAFPSVAAHGTRSLDLREEVGTTAGAETGDGVSESRED